MAAELTPKVRDFLVYWDLGDPERKAALDGMLAAELVRIVIQPEIVKSYG